MRALVADDSAVFRRVLAGILRQECDFGEVSEAADGKDALNQAWDGAFDLILLDWNMPELQGIEVLREIRAKDRTVPVVMVTSERDRERIFEAIDAGVTHYIVKPFTPAAVGKKVKTIMNRYQHIKSRKRSRRAMVVDDSKTVRHVLAKTLRADCGFEEITQAASGTEAIEVFKKHSFDLVLLDWNMPHMQGIDVLRSIRKSDKRTPVIMVTGETDGAHVVEAYDAGASGYLTKPFEPETLVEKVSRVVHIHQ